MLYPSHPKLNLLLIRPKKIRHKIPLPSPVRRLRDLMPTRMQFPPRQRLQGISNINQRTIRLRLYKRPRLRLRMLELDAPFVSGEDERQGAAVRVRVINAVGTLGF